MIELQLLLTDKMHHRMITLKIARHVHDLLLDPVQICTLLCDHIALPQMLFVFRKLTDPLTARSRDRRRNRHRILFAVPYAPHLPQSIGMPLADAFAPKGLVLSARQYHLCNRAKMCIRDSAYPALPCHPG